jgi:PadR family transcriptional regulator, regulatory protein PadR
MTRTELGAADLWEVQLRKGCLELAILAILQGNKLYGLEILQRLESDSDLIVSEGTIYPLLNRLSGLGLLRSEWKESTVGPDRKYYVVTPAGIRRLGEMTKIWEQFSSSMTNLLQPCGNSRGRKHDDERRGASNRILLVENA